MENKQVVLGWWAFLVIISIFNIAFIIIYMLSHKLTDMQKPLFFLLSFFLSFVAYAPSGLPSMLKKLASLKLKFIPPSSFVY